MSQPGERWTLIYAHSADKDLGRLDRRLREQVLAALEALTNNPASPQLRKLKGRPDHRLRVREHRVIVELDPNTRTIRVKRVLPRGRAYER